MKRRSFLSLLGAAPVSVYTAKAAAEAEIAKAAGIWNPNGLGDASMRLAGGGMPAPMVDEGPLVPYEKRLMGAAEYIKAFGLPEVLQVELRDRSRYVTALDPDIACKVSWSMSVKIMTQRQRNYERELHRIEMSGWQQRKRSALKNLLGFDWPH